MSKIGEPTGYTSYGQMWVSGAAKEYEYRGITRDIFDHACYLFSGKRYKELWNYLKPYGVESGIDNGKD